MIRSMTGYGSAEMERDGHRVTAEIRSVNHRYCEVAVRAPRLVSSFEDQIRLLVQERYSRGKFNLSITWVGAGDTGEVLRLNEVVAEWVLGRPATRVEAPIILDEYGNTASAGSLIAFSKHSEDLAAGSIGVMCSFGAGYSLGSLLLQRAS